MATSPKTREHRAEPPRVPEPTPELKRAEQERSEYISGRERVEQRSVLRGLIVLASLVLLFSICRAGLDRVFIGRWWWP